MTRLIPVGQGRWVNPKYVVAAVLHEDEDDGQRTLTLTLDAAALAGANTGALYPDVRGLWIGSVMRALDLNEGMEPEGGRTK